MVEEDTHVMASYVFRGIEYMVSMSVKEGGTLIVEVEDRLTADQWRGSFDAAYIEDLTHKTGNFKQFNIFVSMLETALVQSSESVSLDLLTYADLESLRNRKGGATSSRTIPQAKTAALNTKRYLILTYTVEFDRIHYPLPLPYMGKPDPRTLQETIRHLRSEIKELQQRGMSDYRSRELEKMQREYKKMQSEKELLEGEFSKFKRELRSTNVGTATSEIRVLKGVVQNLEEELLNEKSRFQRTSSKRNQDYKKLLAEVEDLRASERNLRVRVKSLTNELALYKRRAVSSPGIGASSARSRSVKDRSTSRERSWSRDRSRDNSRLSAGRSRDNSRSRDTSRLSAGSRDRSWSRERSRLSQDRSRLSQSQENSRLSQRDRSHSRDRSWAERPPNGGLFRNRTPSPVSVSGSRNPRFNPTAYIKERERKKQETDLKHKRHARNNLSGSSEKRLRPSPARLSPSPSYRLNGSGQSRNRSGNSSGSLHRGRYPSQDSLVELGLFSDSSDSRSRKTSKNSKPVRSTSWNTPEAAYKKTDIRMNGRPRSSTPDKRKERKRNGKENYPVQEMDSDYFDRSAEISEIDARLNRLQQFMKSNLP